MSHIFDFITGQTDCREGREAKANASDDYYRGYSFEYQMDQAKDHMTAGGNHEQDNMANTVSY